MNGRSADSPAPSDSNSRGRGETPATLGYRWPAEWEPHAATWLSWPHNERTWPGAFKPIPERFAEFVRTLAHFEPVRILAAAGPVADDADQRVGQLPNVEIWDVPTNDAWCRDHGPTFLEGPRGLPPALIDWGYNAWGGKYPPFDLDDQVPRRIAERLGYVRFEPGIILEGGAIDGNGLGALLTTTRCMLHPSRNPRLGRADLECYLRDYLAARHVVWLDGGDLEGDDTDGHVDQLARFVGPRTVVCAVESNSDDVNYAPLQTNWRQLAAATDQAGTPLEVVPLPLPAPQFHHGDPERRMPASYCNFLIANGVVIVPTFDDPRDQPALETLAALLPQRAVIGLAARDLIWGLGAYHCLSQQQGQPFQTARD